VVDRTVVVGFGVTGACATRFLLEVGPDPVEVVVVDRDAGLVEQARKLGAQGIVGDCTSRPILARALDGRARCVIVTARPDATAVLTIMIARDLCPEATIVTALCDAEHVAKARQAGADQVIAPSETAGRALATAVLRGTPYRQRP
jgi:voltage-gated potassium channel